MLAIIPRALPVIVIVTIVQCAIMGGLYLLFRLVCKLSVLTSICLAIVIMPIPAILGLRLFGGGFFIGPVFLLLPAVCGVVLIIQFFRWVAKGDQNTGGVVTSEERQKTLKMVDEGKITSQEASELLEALGRSSAMRGQDTFSRLDMMTLAGIGLVVLGFFLPWVYIRIDLPGLLGTSGYQAGYHTGAIGWAVLIIAILAVLPVFITPKDYLYKMSLLQLFLLILVGVITISLLIQARQMGAGLWFCLAGYVVSAIASFMKFKKLAA
jgi:hypothetical protein